MGQILASLNLRGGNDLIVPEINFDIESNVLVTNAANSYY